MVIIIIITIILVHVAVGFVEERLACSYCSKEKKTKKNSKEKIQKKISERRIRRRFLWSIQIEWG